LEADLSGVIFATGGEVHHALGARSQLAQAGMKVLVVNASSLKPLDTAVLERLVQLPWLSVEDHSVIGGLGSALAEWSSENGGPPVWRHGIKDVFGESGDPAEIVKFYNLDAGAIAALARQYFRGMGR
jgi:transketolase